MAKAGRRFPLVIYQTMLNRWWPAILALGVAVLVLAWAIRWWGFEAWRWTTFGLIGIGLIIVSLAMLPLRGFAYIQPFTDHIRVVTPFLRLNISYKRIRKTSSATFGSIFPPNQVSNWRRDIIAPLSKMTAVVVDLNAYPISRTALQLFLSPFFFKDKTPHFVFLVNDWMKFSSELESLRVGGGTPPESQGVIHRDSSSILTRLPRK